MATRTQLRQLIGKLTGQPYFRRFGGSAGTGSASGTTTTLLDTVRLKEEDNYWRGDYIYLSASDEVREISAFTNTTSTVTWLAAVAGATGATTAYEIWSQFTPAEVHAAIDFALQKAWPWFFLTAVDETLVILEDGGIKYTLPTTNTIRRLAQVWLMHYDGSDTGTITTLGTTTQVIDSAATFASADVGKWIAVYEGGSTANGTARQISAVVSATEATVSPAFAVALPAAAKYRILDKNYMYAGQELLQNWKVDKPDNPTTLYLGSHPVGCEGYLLRLFYDYEYAALSSEASTTTCPQDYVIYEALSHLYLQKLASAPATESGTWAALQQRYAQLAKEFIQINKQRHIGGTLLHFEQSVGSLPEDYPF
jgi:hypothetical protein